MGIIIKMSLHSKIIKWPKSAHKKPLIYDYSARIMINVYGLPSKLKKSLSKTRQIWDVLHMREKSYEHC